MCGIGDICCGFIVVGLAVLMSGGVDLASLLRGSQCAYGTLMVSHLPTFAAAVASTGIDFVFIDTEHVPLDRGELERMCFAYKQLGLPPLDAGETDEEVARRLQRAEEEDYGGDLVSFE